jgi:hypothetical protein
MRIPKILIPLAILTVVGCATPAIAPPTPRATMDVGASFGRTWDAVIEQFAERNIPIKTLDRTSGLIATDNLEVGRSLRDAADCGKDWAGSTSIYRPTNVSYNVLVRGDSNRSSVRVNARWIRIGNGRSLLGTGQTTEECSTRGTWEYSLEEGIKYAAQAKK